MCDESKNWKIKPPKSKFKRIVCKALGSRVSDCDKESDYACYIRIGIAVLSIITSLIIIYGVLIK